MLNQTTACAMCGAGFTSTSTNQKYCSQPCRRKAKHTPVIVKIPCRLCGQEFTKTNNAQAYCSKECQAQYKKLKTVLCAACHRQFRTTDKSVTCSDKCRAEHERLQQQQAAASASEKALNQPRPPKPTQWIPDCQSIIGKCPRCAGAVLRDLAGDFYCANCGWRMTP